MDQKILTWSKDKHIVFLASDACPFLDVEERLPQDDTNIKFKLALSWFQLG